MKPLAFLKALPSLDSIVLLPSKTTRTSCGAVHLSFSLLDGHVCLLHFCSCRVSEGLHAPGLVSVTTGRLRAACPAERPFHLQLFEQGPQGLHSPKVHDGWHLPTLHCLLSAVTPQTAPPATAGRTTPRVRYCSPPPHFLEHLAHPDHSPIWQSTLQRTPSLHVTSRLKAGQDAPYSPPLRMGSRVKVWIPASE